jgi:hypothetical protein
VQAEVRVSSLPRSDLKHQMTTAQTLLSLTPPFGSSTMRNGDDPEEERRAWRRWDAEHGIRWRLAVGLISPRDRARLDADPDLADEVFAAEPVAPPGFWSC